MAEKSLKNFEDETSKLIKEGKIKTVKDLEGKIDLNIINKVNGVIIPEFVYGSKEFNELMKQVENDIITIINSHLPKVCELSKEKGNMLLGNESRLKLENEQNKVDSENFPQIINNIKNRIDLLNGILY